MTLPVIAEPLPSSYTFGKVVGRVIHLIADTAEDTDDKPQARSASGTVTFTPKDVLRKTTGLDYPAIVLQATETAVLSGSGRVLDAEGRQGIWLAVGIYTVQFNIDGARNAIPAFDIQVTSDHTDATPLDLAKEAPYVPPTGAVVQTVVVPSGGLEGQTLVRDADGSLMWADVAANLPERLSDTALRAALVPRDEMGTVVADAVADASTVTTAAANAAGAAAADAVATAIRNATSPAVMRHSGATGSFISTPAHSSLHFRDDLDVRVLVAADDWTPTTVGGTVATLVAQGSDASDNTFKFELSQTGGLVFRWSTTGGSYVAKGSAGLLDKQPGGSPLWLRAVLDVDNGAGSCELFFYTSSDSKQWAQLGAPVVTAGVVDLFDSNGPVRIGAYAPTGTTPFKGKLYEVVICDGIDGPPIAHWKAAGHPYTDVTGKVWTVTGTGITREEPPIAALSVIPGRANNLWSWNATSFSNNLTEWGGFQFAAWVGADRYIRVSKRTIGANDWTTVSLQGVTGAGLLNAQVALDGHNVVAIHADADGFLHLAGNMHGDWIKYARSLAAGGIADWESPVMIQPAGAKTGTDEGLVSYPQFLTIPVTGQLFFLYRNGSSGNGDVYLNRYDTTTKTWARVAKLVDGAATSESAYLNTPVFDAAGVLHLSFTWAADGTGFNERTDVCYMKSADGGVTWTTRSGAAVTLPVTHPTAPVILPAATYTGLLNQCGMAVDTAGRPHIAHFWAPDGDRNIWHLYWDGTAWVHEKITTFTETNLTWTGLSRPAIVHYAGRLLIIWRHQYEGWRGKVWATDVTTPGAPHHIAIANMDLREWEPAPDYRAIRRGSLELLVTRVNAAGSPGAIPGYADADWTSQPLGVESIDLARIDQLAVLPELPKGRPQTP